MISSPSPHIPKRKVVEKRMEPPATSVVSKI
jgi:hypothetical protein